jgi:hypothetical protein
VTQPAIPPFASIEQYEQFLQQTPPPGAADQLAAVSSYIRRYCGWHIAPSLTMDLTVDGSGSTILTLPTLHLTALTSITEQGASSPSIYDDVTYDWSANGTVVKANHTAWTNRLSGITATITHGWALEEVGDLAQIVMSTVARAGVNVYGLTNQAVGGVSVGFTAGPGGTAGGLGLYPDQEQTLDLYRLERVP